VLAAWPAAGPALTLLQLLLAPADAAFPSRLLLGILNPVRENLDRGRPSRRIGLVFDRRIVTRGPRPTQGRWRTRVITEGVTPSLHVDFKHSKIKPYHKQARALRTETTINDTGDFGLGRLCNLSALAAVGFTANRRLLDAERLSCDTRPPGAPARP
jgi:hypothetical protein